MRIKHLAPLHDYYFTFHSNLKAINQLHRQNPTPQPEIDVYTPNKNFEVALYILNCEAHNSLSKYPKSALSLVDLTALAHQLRKLAISTNYMVDPLRR